MMRMLKNCEKEAGGEVDSGGGDGGSGGGASGGSTTDSTTTTAACHSRWHPSQDFQK